MHEKELAEGCAAATMAILQAGNRNFDALFNAETNDPVFGLTRKEFVTLYAHTATQLFAGAMK